MKCLSLYPIFYKKILIYNMKTTRLFFTLLLISTLVANSLAQDKKVEFGIMAGYGHTIPRVKDSRSDEVKQTTRLNINQDNLNGFHVGPILKFNFSEQMGFQTGLLFNYFSGMRNDELALKEATGTWKQSKTVYSALDLPLRVVYSMTLAEEFSVFLFGGPNLNYSLNKTTSIEYYVSNNFSREEKGPNIYDTPSEFSALDLQMGAGLGIKYYGVSIRAGYDWGILNRTTIDDVSLRSNDIKVSLAYTF